MGRDGTVNGFSARQACKAERVALGSDRSLRRRKWCRRCGLFRAPCGSRHGDILYVWEAQAQNSSGARHQNAGYTRALDAHAERQGCREVRVRCLLISVHGVSLPSRYAVACRADHLRIADTCFCTIFVSLFSMAPARLAYPALSTRLLSLTLSTRTNRLPTPHLSSTSFRKWHHFETKCVRSPCPCVTVCTQRCTHSLGSETVTSPRSASSLASFCPKLCRLITVEMPPCLFGSKHRTCPERYSKQGRALVFQLLQATAVPL